MKKFSAIILVVLLVFSFTSCGGEGVISNKESVSVYSFSGSNGQLEISNGVIVLTDNEDVFSGGDLKVVHPESFSDVVSYSATFHISTNDENILIMSNSVVDETGESGAKIEINGDLGRISGEDAHIDYVFEDGVNDTDNLWCEIKTTSSDGEKNTYVIDLNVTKITN